MDGIDAVLVRCGVENFSLLETLELPMPSAVRERIRRLSHPGDEEIEAMGALDRELGLLFAQAVRDLLAKAGVPAERVRAIGSHGQTVRHHPPSDGSDPAFTLQIGDPNTIAENTGITTVADFRRRDIAAGGEGAPLVPAFHREVFGSAETRRAIVNIGGIANVSLLLGEEVSGFDTGPGNTLLDQWVERHRGEAYDALGAWAAEGEVNAPLLQQLLSHPYLAQAAPKSTGKEAFNMGWLDSELATSAPLDPQDVQSTLAEFTAGSIADALTGFDIEEVYVCGGGAANTDLMRRLYGKLDSAKLGTTAELGCDPAWVEAAAFAWLAGRTLDGLAGNVPTATGAAGARVLGAVYPGTIRG